LNLLQIEGHYAVTVELAIEKSLCRRTLALAAENLGYFKNVYRVLISSCFQSVFNVLKNAQWTV